MTKHGFALMAVLWTIAALTGALAAWMGILRMGDRASRNRIGLARARWAAEACAEIARGRRAEGSTEDYGSEALGDGLSCRWRLENPFAALNVNQSDSATIERAFALTGVGPGSATMWAHRIVRFRAGQAIESIAQLEEEIHLPAELVALLTVEGRGAVSVNAPPAVLLALSGLSREAVSVLAARREARRPLGSLDELGGLLSRAGRESLAREYAHLSGTLDFQPSVLRLTATGTAGKPPHGLTETLDLLVTEQPGRLAIIRRRLP